MRIPILTGIYGATTPDYRTSLPRNMQPIPLRNGLADGYLRPGDGLVAASAAPPGVIRGAINWNGRGFAVFGTKLCEIRPDMSIAVIGDVGAGKTCLFDYSFDRLAVVSGARLYLWDGLTLVQVTDPDLGPARAMVWIDGYFMTTDGESIVVTELTDPTAVDPLKYGSAEADPDPVTALVRVRGEVYAMNRFTSEVFSNVGGTGFPFVSVPGAVLQKGCVGPAACCLFDDAVAFLGGGRGESISVHIGVNGATITIADEEVSRIIGSYTEAQLADAVLEARVVDGQSLLYVHLPDRTLVHSATASKALKRLVWWSYDSGVLTHSAYRARHFLRVHDKWLCGDPTAAVFGETSQTVSTHWGSRIGWDFGTTILYADGAGAIIHELELLALTGRVAFGADPRIWTSYSPDGLTWSQERELRAGMFGETAKRLRWIRQGSMRHYRMQRFRGTSDAHIAVSGLEATVERLAA